MIRENRDDLNKTYTYSYDINGNILSVSEYTYTTNDTLPAPINVIYYQYEDDTWGDLLTSYNGMSITYDEIGNPLTYRDGINFTWTNGRTLYKFENANYTVTYQYDVNGLRAKKTVYNKITQEYTEYEYYYQEGLLLSQKVTTDEQTIEYWFIYDESGNALGFTLGSTVYYYIKNLQGDVEAITDSNGNVIVNYLYNTWGKLVSINDVSGSNVGINNPIRYRGYYYDTETGFYSLQSRYYDPEIGRFINADDPEVLQLTQGDIIGSNLYAYCKNNPIMYKDPSGYGPVGAIIGGILGFGLGALIVPRIADLLKLKGWGRTAFIWAGVAAITALGVYVGYYVGEAIFQIYKAGGAFASKINEAIARGISKLIGGSISSASGNGWVLKVGKLTLRIMTEGGGRVNYFRLSHATKGAMTILGAFSSDRALTHINITFSNIIQIVSTILKFK